MPVVGGGVKEVGSRDQEVMGERGNRRDGQGAKSNNSKATGSLEDVLGSEAVYFPSLDDRDEDGFPCIDPEARRLESILNKVIDSINGKRLEKPTRIGDLPPLLQMQF